MEAPPHSSPYEPKGAWCVWQAGKTAKPNIYNAANKESVMTEHHLKAIRDWTLATIFYVAACVTAIVSYPPM